MKRLKLHDTWGLVGYWISWLILVLMGCCSVQAQPAPRAVQAQRANLATAWLAQHLYLKETHGYNRAPLIDTWARANGNALGSEWCGLTQWACQKAQKLPTSRGPAGSYNWFLDPTRTVLLGTRGSFDSVQVGYCIGIYSTRRGRIAHITRTVQAARPVRKGRPARGFWCIGGNEGSGAAAAVHRTFYPATGIHAGANWLY